MGDEDFVKALDISIGKRDLEATAEGVGWHHRDLDLFDGLASLRVTPCDEAPLETLGCLGQCVHVEHVVHDTDKRDLHAAVEARLDRLERDHGSTAHEHTLAAGIGDGDLEAFGIVHGPEHERG